MRIPALKMNQKKFIEMESKDDFINVGSPIPERNNESNSNNNSKIKK